MVPPVSWFPAVIDVTVPAPAPVPIHTLLIEKHPPVRLKPFESVDVAAEVEVIAPPVIVRPFVVEIPPENVDVALSPLIVVVAVRPTETLLSEEAAVVEEYAPSSTLQFGSTGLSIVPSRYHRVRSAETL